MIKSKTRKLKYLSNTSAEFFEYRLKANDSLRVDVLTWLTDATGQDVEHPAGTLVLRALTGRGHKTVNHGTVILPPNTSENEVHDIALYMLLNR